MSEVEAYADGSISPALMTSPQQSETTNEFYGRVCVIIPSHDIGLVERFEGGVLTNKGNPDGTNAEFVSIVRAIELCKQKNLAPTLVYNDSKGAVKRANSPEVQWLPAGEFNPASAFLQRVLDRAAYLRQSVRKITQRAPLMPSQSEAFRLLQSEREVFKLSDSPIWAKIQADLNKGGLIAKATEAQ